MYPVLVCPCCSLVVESYARARTSVPHIGIYHEECETRTEVECASFVVVTVCVFPPRRVRHAGPRRVTSRRPIRIDRRRYVDNGHAHGSSIRLSRARSLGLSFERLRRAGRFARGRKRRAASQFVALIYISLA